MLVAAGFEEPSTDVRYLNLRLYPGGLRFSKTNLGRQGPYPATKAAPWKEAHPSDHSHRSVTKLRERVDERGPRVCGSRG